jgi:hypothetical protein
LTLVVFTRSLDGCGWFRRCRFGSNDKRSFFAMMSADVIKAMTQAAFEDDVTASDCFEMAAREWLERRKGKK